MRAVLLLIVIAAAGIIFFMVINCLRMATTIAVSWGVMMMDWIN